MLAIGNTHDTARDGFGPIPSGSAVESKAMKDRLVRVRRVIGGTVLLALLGLLCPGRSHSGQYGPGWSFPVDISYPDTAGQDLSPRLLCDQYQNLHVLWAKSYGTGSAIYYRSDVAGVLSEANAVVAVHDPLAVALSAAISSRDDVIHVIWQNSWVRGEVYYSRASLSDASSAGAWSRPRILVSAPDGAAISVDGDAIVRIWYGVSDDRNGQGEVVYIESRDSGEAWSDPIPVYQTILPTPSIIRGNLVVDKAGRMHASVSIRSQTYGAYSELLYLRSIDAGHTWEQEVVAGPDSTSPGVAGLALFVLERDEIHRTWHHPERLHQWSVDGGETWSDPVEIIDLGWGFGGTNALARDSAGVLHVVTGVGNGVFSASFDGSTWGAAERIEARAMDPHSQTIAVCQGNQLHVAYDDRIGDETTVWYSRRVVNAPHIGQLPVPQRAVPAAEPVTAHIDATTVPTRVGVTPPTGSGRGVSSQSSSAVTAAEPLVPLLVSAGSVLILMAVVLAIRLNGQHRR